MPGVTDIEVEFPCSRERPRIIDLSDDAESDGEPADLVNGITPAVGRERLIPDDPTDDLTSEEAISAFLNEADETGDPTYIAHAREVTKRAKTGKK